MAFSRYTRDDYTQDGLGLEPSRSIVAVRRAIRAGTIPITRQIIATQADRLDTISGAVYGDGRYWWVLAAASNVGWGLQVPPGTLINIPDLRSVEQLIG